MTMTAGQDLELEERPPPDLAPEPPAASPPSTGRGGGLDRLRALGWAVVGLAGLGLLWQLAAAASPDLPSPSEGLKELWRLVSDPFYDNGPNDKGIGRQLLISL
ncbi:MAG: hypothetical protein ACRD0S_13885, partial [Acidimicrobiales bacterium]